MNQRPLVEELQEIDFLHGFSRDYLEELAAAATVRDYAAAQVVFREGDPATSAYLAVSGKVSLEICAPSVGCRRILTVGPGEFLGWSAVLGESRLTATARTLEPTRLVELDAGRLLARFRRRPRFAYDFTLRAMRALARRLNATRVQLLDVYGAQPSTALPLSEADDGR